MRFEEKLFTCHAEKKKRFQISHFYWSFPSDIMAVKGLKNNNKKTHTGHSHDPAAIPCRPQTPRQPAPSRNVGSVPLAGHDACTAERTG